MDGPRPDDDDYFALLGLREVVAPRQPLGSKLQLQLSPGLAAELGARREVRELRRRRAALLAQQLELERRESLRPLTRNAVAAAGGGGGGAPLLGRPLSPDERREQRLRRRGLEGEWEAERRRRLEHITHHALPEGLRTGSGGSPDARPAAAARRGSPGACRPASAGAVLQPQRQQQPWKQLQPWQQQPEQHPQWNWRPAPHHQQQTGTDIGCAGAAAAGELWRWTRFGSAASTAAAAAGVGCCSMCMCARPPSPERALEALRAPGSPVRRSLGEALKDVQRGLWPEPSSRAEAPAFGGKWSDGTAQRQRRAAEGLGDLEEECAPADEQRQWNGGWRAAGDAVAAKADEVAARCEALGAARERLVRQQLRQQRKLQAMARQLQGPGVSRPPGTAPAGGRRASAGGCDGSPEPRRIWIP